MGVTMFVTVQGGYGRQAFDETVNDMIEKGYVPRVESFNYDGTTRTFSMVMTHKDIKIGSDDD